MNLRATTVRAPVMLAMMTLAGCPYLADGNLGIDIHVTSISPAQVPSTGGARVTIVGTNLDDGVTVKFGGQEALAVERVGDGVLDVVPPPHAVGNVDVEVIDPDGRRVAVKDAVHYFAGTPAASAGTLFLPGPMPGAPVFGGDIDGDGIDDALVWQLDTPGWSAALLDGQGRPRVGERVPLQTAEDGTSPLALADVDGDGLADAIMPNGIALSAGGDHWRDLQFFLFGGGFTSVGAVGDFDGDGVKDVAVQTPDGVRVVAIVGGTVTVKAEQLGGVYAPRLRFFGAPEQPVAGDFDGDGKADLAWVDGTGELRVAKGPDLAVVTDLGAAPPFHEQVGAAAGVLAAIDVDWDLHVDLVAADNAGTFVYRGAVGGIVKAPLALPALCEAPADVAGVIVAARDVSQGATLAARCGEVTRLVEPAPTEKGLELVSKGQLRTLPRAPIGLADLDGDGQIDVLEVTDPGTLTWYSKFDGVVPYGSARVPGIATGGTLGLVVVTGSFGGDAQMVVAHGARVALVRNPLAQDAIVDQQDISPDTSLVEQMAACDIDGDGVDDVIATSSTGSTRELRAILVKNGKLAISKVLGTTDVGETFMVVGRGSKGCEAWWLHDDDTTSGVAHDVDTFVVSATAATHHALKQLELNDDRSLKLVDLDGDGALELYSPCAQSFDEFSHQPLVLKPEGDHLTPSRPGATDFTTCGTHVEKSSEWGIAPRGDKTFTLWATSAGGIQGENSITLSTLHADGSIDRVDQVAVPALGADDGDTMAIADVDGDGLADAIVGPPLGSTGGHVLVLTHPEEGGVQLALTIDVADGAGASPIQWSALAATDVDGDGFPDVVFATGDYGDRLGVIRNESH